VPTALPTVVPTVIPTATPSVRVVAVRLSWYDPALLGPNCHPANVHNGKCHASLYGREWQEWVGIGLACPADFPLGSDWYIKELGKTFKCVDRGGAITQLPDGSYFVDLLRETPVYVHNGHVVVDKWSPSGHYLASAEVK